MTDEPRDGFTMIPNWLLRESVLTVNEFMVYAALLSRANPRQEAWPSVRILSVDSRLSEATVKRTLPRLESRGLITKTVRPRGDGTNLSNLYRVAVLKDRPTKGSAYAHLLRPVRQAAGEGVTVNPPGGQGEPTQGVTVTVEEDPSEEEPSEEDMRSELPSGLDEAYLSNAPERFATDRQVSYLRDLYIQHHQQIPGQHIEAEIRALDPDNATRLIKTYLRTIKGRGGMYDGVEEGTPEYEALSPQGQAWADEGMLPPDMWVTPTPAGMPEAQSFGDLFRPEHAGRQAS